MAPQLVLFLVLLVTHANAGPLREKRAFSYIANQTVCVVDGVIYHDGDPIPTDDACESCKCRPPGFSCVLRECEVKPGCKAIRREGECCPEYQCGCEHNGKFFNDGDRIPNAESPCYSCYCQGSSITCALADCKFRFDCEPEYVPGECCPRYDHCPPEPGTVSTPSSTTTTQFTSVFSTILPSSSTQSSIPTTINTIFKNNTTKEITLPTTVQEITTETAISQTPPTTTMVDKIDEAVTEVVKEVVTEAVTSTSVDPITSPSSHDTTNDAPLVTVVDPVISYETTTVPSIVTTSEEDLAQETTINRLSKCSDFLWNYGGGVFYF